MSRQTSDTLLPEDFFSHQALELTYRLLRNNNPGLATAIQNTLSHLNPVPYETLQGAHTGEMLFTADVYNSLSAHTIGKIVSALTTLGERALIEHSLHSANLSRLRQLIDDWVQLTEWILQHTTTDRSAYQ